MWIVLNKMYVLIIDCSGELIYFIMTTCICVYEMYVVMNCLIWSLLFIIIFVHFVKQNVQCHYWLFRWIHIVIMTTYICVYEMYVVMNYLIWSLIFIIIFIHFVKKKCVLTNDCSGELIFFSRQCTFVYAKCMLSSIVI